ncbi:MAG TPA: tripartite tricarboxylate transporter substrate-binding protein [Burkholderiales bacterium]|nr:tripartite tricarboxylate transporter substrate-binding protein [Burkholderiales bacterium]
MAALVGAARIEAQQLPSAPYPGKAIRIIVPSSPGTASDFFARVLADELAATYQQNIMVDNHAGAGGLIGNWMISKAAPDGYTLAMVRVSRIISQLIREEAPYRALADITAVAHVASITYVLAVTRNVDVQTVAQLVAHARPRPGELNYASVGIGSSSHFAAEIFTRETGIDVVHVPYRNLSDAFVEMMLGRVHYSIFTVPAVLPLVRDGRLRALAVMTSERSAALPGVPTIAEAGVPEATFENWSGIVAPAGTPRRIVEQLHGDIVHALRKRELRVQLARQGAESTTDSTPDGFMRLMRREYLRYQHLVRDAKIKLH